MMNRHRASGRIGIGRRDLVGGWLAMLLAGVLAVAMLVVLPAGAAPNDDKKPPARPARPDRPDRSAAKRAEDKAREVKDEAEEFERKLAAEAASMPDLSEEGQAMLAARDRKQGATWPGKDPAFLVLARPGERSKMAEELLNPKVRQMTKQALDYLVGKQSNSDGSWSDAEFKDNTGVTALAVLAFMAQGSRPRIGPYGKQIDRGLEFILNNVQTGGVIAGKGSNPLGPGYENAFSTLALLYAYGDMPYKPEVRGVISRSIQVILRSQKLDGGWRYDFSREGQSDMSVTANVLWVLRTAKKAGFTVDPAAVKRGVSFVQKCAMPDGTFRYRTFGIVAEPSLGGTGVIALCNDGSLDHPLIPRARDRIDYDYKRYSIDDLKNRRYFVFGCFYASLSQYACGDEYWIPWFKKASEVLAAVQLADGAFEEFDGKDRTGRNYSVWSTAMGAIVLQAPLGYLPIYER